VAVRVSDWNGRKGFPRSALHKITKSTLWFDPCDLRRRLIWQLHLQLIEQKLEVFFGVGIACEHDLPFIGRRDTHIEHLDCFKFLQHRPGRKPRSTQSQPRLQRDMKAVDQKRDQDVRVDPVLPLVIDRAQG
jgi:hypothetical protein